MKTTTWRGSAARWPGMALMALALHASGQAEAGAGFGGYASPAQQYALALEAQTRGDYAAMLTWLRAAAHDGHVPAQRMLGVALIGGPVLYGPSLRADLCEGRRWLLRAARQNEAPGEDVAYALFGRPRDALTAHCEAS
ncbi:sel1 repeat family protein [Achromobacter deleyi]|uniref:sel1 repeat family protein n=1 Tax=Achromobacter deleyi TaxID=1353891 RepID=UPI001490A1F7|nr:sel1 repeat family protein [Achromobacter deleyi]QVQ26527.1 sel1 repeat family protein [Achromobacter deleyi]UIP22099.1 sel1 repeat family protein [Achromobacter deleyi]